MTSGPLLVDGRVPDSGPPPVIVTDCTVKFGEASAVILPVVPRFAKFPKPRPPPVPLPVLDPLPADVGGRVFEAPAFLLLPDKARAPKKPARPTDDDGADREPDLGLVGTGRSRAAPWLEGGFGCARRRRCLRGIAHSEQYNPPTGSRYCN